MHIIVCDISDTFIAYGISDTFIACSESVLYRVAEDFGKWL